MGANLDIIPEQNHINQSSPERDLWASVLDQAVNDLNDTIERPRAIAWFWSDNDYEGSFQWICMILDLEPVKVRQVVVVVMVA
jgi:hypothetical protein